MAKILPVLFAIVCFGVGTSLKLSDFKRASQYKLALLYGILGQFVFLPLIVFLTCLLVQLDPYLSIGMIVITVAPTSSTSDVFSFLFKGNPAFSLSMAAITMILTPFTIPLYMQFFINYFLGAERSIALNVRETLLLTLSIGVLPVFLGMLFRKLNPSYARASRRFFEAFSTLFAFFILIGALIQFMPYVKSIGQFLFLSLISLILSIVAISIGIVTKKILGVPEQISRSIIFEISLQSASSSQVIALNVIKMEEVIPSALVFGMFLFWSAVAYGYYLKTKVPINRYNVSV